MTSIKDGKGSVIEVRLILDNKKPAIKPVFFVLLKN